MPKLKEADEDRPPLKAGYSSVSIPTMYPSVSPSDMLSGKHQEEQESRKKAIQDMGERVKSKP